MTREEALAILRKENGVVYSEYEEAVDVIEKALADRPHGEWIPKAVHNCWTRFECSVCGYYHEPVHDFGESKPDYNFCPNCGADMRKEGDEK